MEASGTGFSYLKSPKSCLDAAFGAFSASTGLPGLLLRASPGAHDGRHRQVSPGAYRRGSFWRAPEADLEAFSASGSAPLLETSAEQEQSEEAL